MISDALKDLRTLVTVSFSKASGHTLRCEFCFPGHRRLTNGLVPKPEVWLLPGGLVKASVPQGSSVWDGDSMTQLDPFSWKV